jgi:hypothetical protein
MDIRIRTGEIEINAALNNSVTASRILKILPIKRGKNADALNKKMKNDKEFARIEFAAWRRGCVCFFSFYLLAISTS